MFRRPVAADGKGENFPALAPLATLDGAWNVAFDPAWGGPASATFDSLVDWTKRPEESIRHYSGTAVYRKTFDAAAPKGRTYLDLGEIHSMGRVRLNGKDLGLVWCAPWRIDVTDALRAGSNTLEIEVTNPWQNRIVGDQALPEGRRLTSTTVPGYRADSPLLPAGLLGPVRLLGQSTP